MNKDVIYELIAKDELILQYGSRILYNNRKEKGIYHHVSTKMREIGRLVYLLNESYNIKSLQQAIAPQHFKNKINAVKELCGFDPTNNKFKRASLASKIGYALHTCVDILGDRGSLY